MKFQNELCEGQARALQRDRERRLRNRALLYGRGTPRGIPGHLQGADPNQEDT